MPPPTESSSSLYGQVLIPAVLLFLMFALKYWRSGTGRIQWIGILAVASAIALMLGGGLWLFVGRQIPAENSRIFECPMSDIQSVAIQPDDRSSLINRELVFTNASKIQEIMGAIRSAGEYYPNHPGEEWDCVLIISDAKGTSRLDVENTLDQGTIVYCETHSGFIYKTLESDTLGNILEQTTMTERSTHLPAQTHWLFHCKTASVPSLLVLPLGSLSLVGHGIKVTNMATIDRIIKAIQTAKVSASEQPSDRWNCTLFLIGPTGPIYVSVYATSNQGTILYCPGGPFRCDILADILEKVAGENK